MQQSQDIEVFIQERIDAAKAPIQPYLILVQAALTSKIVRHFLVLDSSPVQITVNSTVNAIDILFKSYFIFNVHFPLGWRNTFHFLQTAIYKFFEKRDPRCRQDAMTPSETELMARLQSM